MNFISDINNNLSYLYRTWYHDVNNVQNRWYKTPITFYYVWQNADFSYNVNIDDELHWKEVIKYLYAYLVWYMYDKMIWTIGGTFNIF